MRGIAMAIIWLAMMLDVRLDRGWQREPEAVRKIIGKFLVAWFVATILVILGGW